MSKILIVTDLHILIYREIIHLVQISPAHSNSEVNIVKKAGIEIYLESAADYYLVAFNQNQKAADGSIVPKDFSGTIFNGYNLSQDRIYSTNFIDTPADDRNIFDTYRLYPELNRDRVEKWWSLNQNGVARDGTAEYLGDAEAKALFYDITERVSAAYAMNTFNLGNYLTFIAGLRIETEANNYNSKNAPLWTHRVPDSCRINIRYIFSS